MNEISAENTDSIRNSLYRIGGVAGFICALMYAITLGVYIPAYRVGPPPATVLEWFTLFQTNPLTGLFFLGLADVVIVILWGPLVLAIYDALRVCKRISSAQSAPGTGLRAKNGKLYFYEPLER
ncbi:MAG: hypothetical protein JXR84_20690 [Anaerolineae bacterium]|nr:hypothetical protein [Anaerolineae bacterium]